MIDPINIPSENIDKATSFVSTYSKNDEFIPYCSGLEYQAYVKAKVLANLKNSTSDIILNEFGAGVLYSVNGALVEVPSKNSLPERSYKRSKARQNFNTNKQQYIESAKKGFIHNKSVDERWFLKNKDFIIAGIKEALNEHTREKHWEIDINAPAFRENGPTFHHNEIYSAAAAPTNTSSIRKITVNFSPISDLYKNNSQTKKDYAKTLAEVFALYKKGQKYIKDKKNTIRDIHMHVDFRWKEFDKYNISLSDLPEITDADLEFICLELELDYVNDFKKALAITEDAIKENGFDEKAKEMFANISLAGLHHFSQKKNDNATALNFKNPDDTHAADEAKKGHPLVNEAFLDQSMFILLDIALFGEASKKGPVLYPKPENDAKDPSLKYINNAWEIVDGSRINFAVQKNTSSQTEATHSPEPMGTEIKKNSSTGSSSNLSFRFSNESNGLEETERKDSFSTTQSSSTGTSPEVISTLTNVEYITTHDVERTPTEKDEDSNSSDGSDETELKDNKLISDFFITFGILSKLTASDSIYLPLPILKLFFEAVSWHLLLLENIAYYEDKQDQRETIIKEFCEQGTFILGHALKKIPSDKDLTALVTKLNEFFVQQKNLKTTVQILQHKNELKTLLVSKNFSTIRDNDQDDAFTKKIYMPSKKNKTNTNPIVANEASAKELFISTAKKFTEMYDDLSDDSVMLTAYQALVCGTKRLAKVSSSKESSAPISITPNQFNIKYNK